MYSTMVLLIFQRFDNYILLGNEAVFYSLFVVFDIRKV